MVGLVEAPAPNLEWTRPLNSPRVSALEPQSCRSLSIARGYSSEGRAYGVLFGSSGSGASCAACWPRPRRPRDGRRPVSLRGPRGLSHGIFHRPGLPNA